MTGTTTVTFRSGMHTSYKSDGVTRVIGWMQQYITTTRCELVSIPTECVSLTSMAPSNNSLFLFLPPRHQTCAQVAVVHYSQSQGTSANRIPGLHETRSILGRDATPRLDSVRRRPKGPEPTRPKHCAYQPQQGARGRREGG